MPAGEQLSDLVWSLVIGLTLIAAIAVTIMGARLRSRPDAAAETDNSASTTI